MDKSTTLEKQFEILTKSMGLQRTGIVCKDFNTGWLAAVRVSVEHDSFHDIMIWAPSQTLMKDLAISILFKKVKF